MFTKMHAQGNDFILLNEDDLSCALTPGTIQSLGDRRRGLGFDQLILYTLGTANADASIRFFNADGGAAGACGNGTRCAASLIGRLLNKSSLVLQTATRPIQATITDNYVCINMGSASHDPSPFHVESLPPGVCVDMGNPHVVFFVPDVSGIDLEVLGPRIEHHPYFPNRTNVAFATIADHNTIEAIVWERGAGRTLACGSGACAIVVAAHATGLIASNNVTIRLQGGHVNVKTDPAGDLFLSGTVMYVATGQFCNELIDSLK